MIIGYWCAAQENKCGTKGGGHTGWQNPACTSFFLSLSLFGCSLFFSLRILCLSFTKSSEAPCVTAHLLHQFPQLFLFLFLIFFRFYEKNSPINTLVVLHFFLNIFFLINIFLFSLFFSFPDHCEKEVLHCNNVKQMDVEVVQSKRYANDIIYFILFYFSCLSERIFQEPEEVAARLALLFLFTQVSLFEKNTEGIHC